MIKVNCQQCNKEFYIKPFRKDKAKYCSYKCYWQTLKGNKRPQTTGEKNPMWKGGKITIKCLICNKLVKVYQSNKNRKYCSPKCQYIEQLGKTPSLGYKHTDKAKDKIRQAHLEEKNHNWKGDKAGYRAIHSWIIRKKGKASFCEHCEDIELHSPPKRPKYFQWANIDHKYRRNVDDFISLCIPCHKKYDRKRREE